VRFPFLNEGDGEELERARETEMVREVYMEMVGTEIAEGRWTEFGVRL
jgi:hypothetical protein